MADQRPPFWNLVSLAMPFVGFGIGFLIGVFGQGILWSGHPMDGIFWGVLPWTIFCVLGFVAAIVAKRRQERMPRVTIAAMILNAALPVLLLYSGITALLGWLENG